MSTSDAGELRLRAAPPARSTTRTLRTREQQGETVERLQPENHIAVEIPKVQDRPRAPISQEGANRAQHFGADRIRQREVNFQKPYGQRFSSSLLITLSRNQNLDKSHLNWKSDSCLNSLTEPRAETEKGSCQVNSRSSAPDTPAATHSYCRLPQTKPFLATKEKDVVTVGCNELETTRHLNVDPSLPNGNYGPNQCNGLHLRPCRAQLKRTGTGPIEVEEDIEYHTTLETLKDPERSKPAVTMLSSTVVGVLAPTWSGRIRRNKRFDGTGNSDSQGNLQDVTSTVARNAHGDTQNQHGPVRVMAEGSQPQVRAPFQGTRRNTLDWSTMSDPLRMDYSNNERIQTVSLDVNSGRTDDRKLVPGGLSPVTTNTPRLSPTSFDSNEQRRNPQTYHQGPMSPLSSKPTTSSLLLSLRRINYSGRSSNALPTFPGENPAPTDQEGNLLPTHLSQTFFNNNEQERSKPVRSPSSISYRSTEVGPDLSPSSFNHRERSVSESPFFSTSTLNEDKKDTPFTQQPQTCFKQAFLSNVPSASQQVCRGSNKNPNLFPKSSIPSPRHSPYNPSELVKTHPVPRRTTLTSTSWWKQVTKEGSSPLSPDDTTNIKDQPNTPLVPPCNNSSALAGPTLTDSKRFSSQIPNNTNTTESVCKGNMNLIMTEGGTQSLKQIKDLPEHKSDVLFRRQYGSYSNNREPLKPLNWPDVLSRSSFNKATAKTTLSHPKDLSKGPVNNSSFTANLTELPPTLLNLKSSDSPTESSSKYKNDLGSSETSSTPTSLHNKDTERLTKPSLTLSSTIPHSSQAPTIKTTPGLPPTPNTRTETFFNFHPVSSQTYVHTSDTETSSQTSKLTETANITPLGFKRSYVFIPTHPKAVSSLIPTVSASPKINNIPVSPASVTSSNIASHPAVTTAPSPSYLTPAIKLSPTTNPLSSLLTPPTTPIITSPSYLDASNPKEGRTFSSSPERDNKKGKRVRRVTWEDSVDLQCPDPITVEKPDPSGVPTSPPSPCVRTPSISPFLSSRSPTINTSSLCPTTPKTSSIKMGKGGRYRSSSSDLADLTSTEVEMSKQGAKETLISEPARQDLTTTGQERTQSRESCKVQGHSSAALSLPPDFSTGYKLRYSSPPYSSLMSSRTTQAEPKTITPRSPLFRHASRSVHTQLSLHAEPGSGKPIPTSKSPLAPVSPTETLSFPVKNRIATKESSCEVSETYQLNNQRQNTNQDPKNGQILLVDNRVHISSQGEKAHNSTCVTETLVYNIQFKANTATTASKNTTPLQHTEAKLSQQPKRVQNKKATGEPQTHSGQSSSSGSSADSQSQCEGSRKSKTKENVLGKSRFFSVESSNEQSPKRSRFALKKSVSTPNSSLSRSDSDRSNKTNNKMDQVLNKIKQTFSTRRSDDDPSFPWKWKKASQTPHVSGSSDIGTVSDVPADTTKTVKERDKEGFVVSQDSDQGTECTKIQTQNRYSIIPPPAVTSTGGQFSVWSEKSTPEIDQDEQNACAGLSDNKTQVHVTPHSPTIHHLDFFNDSRTYYKPTLQLPTFRDPSPGRSPNPSGSCPTQFRKSTSSSRSPFSPFPSLSPVSPFSSPDISDDNVFYSPKLQRCKESSAPCEQGERIGPGGSRRSRASTGPPSPVAGQDNEHFASSYADLKYGIEPGRSFSVSSVLSSRPSGPGRISTGSRFLSVGDLSKSSFTCGVHGKDLDQWSFGPDWTTEYDCRPPGDNSGSYFRSDPAKIKSRSLPRSLTRRLGNCSSGDCVSQPGNTTGSKQAHLWSPNMNTFQFELDAEGPPTPPATPPLSPVARRMSQPPSPTSPTFPSPPGAPQSVDSQSSRGRLPSRGYVSSLSTFDESSDSSSDTTTDDEYYLETGDGEEKETEL